MDETPEAELSEMEQRDYLIKSLTARCNYLEKEVAKAKEKARLANARADNHFKALTQAQHHQKLYEEGWKGFEHKLENLVRSVGYETSKRTLYVSTSGQVYRQSGK